MGTRLLVAALACFLLTSSTIHAKSFRKEGLINKITDKILIIDDTKYTLSPTIQIMNHMGKEAELAFLNIMDRIYFEYTEDDNSKLITLIKQRPPDHGMR